MTRWTTAADVRAQVRRRWDDETLLRALGAGDPFPVIDIALRKPEPGEIGEDLDAVRVWATGLESASHGGSRFTVRRTMVGGRYIGRNEIPDRAVIDAYEQAWALLGVTKEATEYRRILDLVAVHPGVLAWVRSRPLRALTLSDAWPGLLAVCRWLRDNHDSGRYLREIDVPGVDTKFVERHRSVLAQILQVPATATGFVAGLGLQGKPERVRVRAHASLGVAPGLSDLTVRVDELASLSFAPKSAMVIENETTFLSAPIPDGGILLWGKGFEVDRAGSMPWLVDTPVTYWGDLDTHGFAILNQFRAWLPQTHSLMMDRATLLQHRDFWVVEATPTTARLARLTPDEQALYEDLVTDRFSPNVRLEQERINWAWANARLPTSQEP